MTIALAVGLAIWMKEKHAAVKLVTKTSSLWVSSRMCMVEPPCHTHSLIEIFYFPSTIIYNTLNWITTGTMTNRRVASENLGDYGSDNDINSVA